MSHANGLVRFPDGLVMYFEYNGTTDVCLPKLWPTYKEMYAHWREEDFERKCTCGRPPETVDAFNDYADGTNWKTTACRHCMAIIDIRDPWEHDENYEANDGYPDWVKAAGFLE